jgi:hypothetical protein
VSVEADKEPNEEEQVVKVQPEENIEFVNLQIRCSCCLLKHTLRNSAADVFQTVVGR